MGLEEGVKPEMELRPGRREKLEGDGLVGVPEEGSGCGVKQPYTL